MKNHLESFKILKFEMLTGGKNTNFQNFVNESFWIFRYNKLSVLFFKG